MNRDRRITFSYQLFSSKDLFFSGILCIPALVFTPNLYFRVGIFVYFYFFTWLQGKRNSLIFTTVITTSIVFFNLLVPYGRVLFQIGEFTITLGALMSGIEKAVTLEALIMLSKASIRSDLQLPGAFGALIAESFQIFEGLLARKKQFNWKNPIESIDNLLLELTNSATSSYKREAVLITKQKRAVGRTLLILQTALLWLLWLFLYN